MKKEILIIILLLLLSYPAVKSLFIPGGFTSHDLTHHVVRQISMDKLLSQGQFPPRWSGDLNNGYGYPVFLFNYPLPALVGEVFHKLGFGFVDSVKAVLFTSMILSILGMYLFLKELLDIKLAAFLGSIFYLYAPIRFLNVYVSAALGSVLASGLIPFIFWSMVLIKKERKWGVWIGSLSLAGLILAHNVTTLIFAPVLLIFSLFLTWQSKDKARILRGFGAMFLLGFGMSAWFWLPAIFEKQYIKFDQIYNNFYLDQFVNLWQLIRSPWGYGLSHPQNPEPGDMSYQLGLVHILVMFMLIPLLWIRRKNTEVRVIGGFTLAFFSLSVFLMLKNSLPFWQSVSFLSLIQFPLRFQVISVFSASIAAGLLIKYFPFKKIVFAILLILVIYANRNHWNINQKFDPGEKYYLNLKTTSTTYGEHLPKWGKVVDKASKGKLEFVKGIGQISIIKDQSAYILAEIEATTASKLRFNQFYLPGWEIKVDNKKKDFNYLSDGESYGLPQFDIYAGKHQILAQFKNTTDRNIADGISVIIFITIIIIICRQLIPNLLKAKKSFSDMI